MQNTYYITTQFYETYTKFLQLKKSSKLHMLYVAKEEQLMLI